MKGKRNAGMIGVLALLLMLSVCGKNAGEELGSAPYVPLETMETAAVQETVAVQENAAEKEKAAVQETTALPETENRTEPESGASSEESGAMKMNVQAGRSTFTATLEDNPAVDALVQMMGDAPVVIQMNDYSGFEKVGSMGASLPASDRQTNAQSGDIVLYNGNQIVIFYGSNTWSYTRLGKIDDLSGWKEALGDSNVTVTFSMDRTLSDSGQK